MVNNVLDQTALLVLGQSLIPEGSGLGEVVFVRAVVPVIISNLKYFPYVKNVCLYLATSPTVLIGAVMPRGHSCGPLKLLGK